MKKKKRGEPTPLDSRLFINTLLLILIFFLLLNTYLTVELNKKIDKREKDDLFGLFLQKEPVDLIYLVDEDCVECYDVTLHKFIIDQLGSQSGEAFRYGDIRRVDILSEDGEELVLAYDISLVPTVIISKEANQFYWFEQVWGEVGTKEDDGVYVFRYLEKFTYLTYKDIVNEVVLTAP